VSDGQKTPAPDSDQAPAGMPAVDGQERRRLGRRAQLLAGVSVIYNLVEAAVAVTAGAAAGSVALVGFGLDSVVEVSSGLVILWQFRARLPESRERAAQQAIAVSFFALAAYVTVESTRTLLGGGAGADSSPVGIALAAASLLVMPFLSAAQHRTGRRLGSGSVVADGTQTLLCTYLSAVLLAGLVLNAALGWSWADPLAGLVIAAVAVKEGIENWRGDGCCTPANSSSTSSRGTAGANQLPVVVSADGNGTGCRSDCCTNEPSSVDPAGTAAPADGVVTVLTDGRPAPGAVKVTGHSHGGEGAVLDHPARWRSSAGRPRRRMRPRRRGQLPRRRSCRQPFVFGDWSTTDPVGGGAA
jgi:hypothetical protein